MTGVIKQLLLEVGVRKLGSSIFDTRERVFKLDESTFDTREQVFKLDESTFDTSFVLHAKENWTLHSCGMI
ncbi:MAG: hypothetical protein V7K35_02925 [Nostoc sp.]|uniref:hypothetical protein n=1 Tax=Nostoc sp. TaxID=1180 RepID=UPI002FFCF71A